MEPVNSCPVCHRNLAYVKSPVTHEGKIFCGRGCVSIADGTTHRNIRKSRIRDRMALLVRYYLLLLIGVGSVAGSVIIYGNYLEGTVTLRRPVSFLSMPVFGVLISAYSIREIVKMHRKKSRRH